MKFNKKLLLIIFLMFLLLVSNSVSASLTNGLVSYYKLDETSGTLALDSVGSNNGTISNSRVTNGAGKINYGADFSKGNDLIDLGDGNLDFTGAITISQWVKINQTGQFHPLVVRDCGTAVDCNQYGTFVYNTNKFRFAVNPTVTERQVFSNTTLTTDTWYHVVGVFTGTELQIWVNGVMENYISWNGVQSTTTSNTTIGHRNNSLYTNGTIDEVGIWNRSLNETEILDLYASGLGLQYPFDITKFSISTNLHDFDIEMVSNETLTYNSSSIIYTTPINLTDERLWNITITSEGYRPIEYINYNISLNGSISTTMIISIYNITFNASDIMGTSLYPFNITLSNASKYLIENENTTINISYELYENITFSKTDWYDLTIYNQTINFDGQINFTNVYDSILNITQIELPYNTSLNNFSGYVYQIDNDYNVSFSTTTNTTTVNLIQDYNYSIYVNPTSLYSSYTTNVSINSTTTDLFVYVYRLSSIYISFYDELNLSLMNYTNITLEVISDPYGYETNTLNGTIYLVNLTPNEYILRYSAENYTTRERIVTVIGTDYEVLSLYMISNSSVDHEDITFNVRDYTDNDIENADVKALKYDITTGNYIFIDSCRTNFLGECSMNLEYNSEYYKFQVEYESVIRLTTSPTYITSTSYVLRIDIGDDFTSDYFNYQDIDASLVYNNATNNFRLTYNDNNNLASNFCVYVYSFRYLEKTFVASSCSQTSSGTVLVPITPLNGTYYVAYAYYDDPAIFLISASYEVPISELFSTQGIFLQILLTIMFAVASLKFIEFTGLSVSLSLILGKMMNLNTLGWEAIIGILVASVVIIFVLRRDK